MRPVVCNEYLKIMDFVDKADQATMANLFCNHKKHGSTAEMVWVVTMLLTMNTKKLFKSASGKVIEHGKEWRDYLIDCLFDCTLGDKKDHPPSEPDKKSRLSRCHLCCVLGQKQVCTTWKCQICGPFCKSCQMGGKESQHEAYWKLPTLSQAI